MPNTSVAEIKEFINDRIGDDIQVTIQMGRRRKVVRRGILQEAYHSVFVVELDQDECNFDRASYSYRDVLTDDVEVEFI